MAYFFLISVAEFALEVTISDTLRIQFLKIQRFFFSVKIREVLDQYNAAAR